MSEKEYKEKARNCFLQNTILLNKNKKLEKENKELKAQVENMKRCGNCNKLQKVYSKDGKSCRLTCNGLNISPDMYCNNWEQS